MAKTLFSDTTSNVMLLVEQVRQGDLALPDIQRPFVWPTTKVRDLLDSMYRGYPVGYLLFWDTGAATGARQIGMSDKLARVPYSKKLIVDGQQRLTSLFAVMTGTPVVREDYTASLIRIAFRPSDATFAVTDAAIEKDAELIPDISTLWAPGIGAKRTFNRFLARLRQKREIREEEAERLEESLDGVTDLRYYPFKIVELSAEVDEEKVAEVFVRINSEGVTLNQADFILTLMSVWWEKGRRQLEEFSRAAELPSLSASPFNYHVQLSHTTAARHSRAGVSACRAATRVHAAPRAGHQHWSRRPEAPGGAVREARGCPGQGAGSDQLARVPAVPGTRRSFAPGRCSHRKTSSCSVTRCGSSAASTSGCRCPGSARSSLGGSSWPTRPDATPARLRISSRQTWRGLADLRIGDADGFLARLNNVIEDTMTADFWSITLPNELATSASKPPSLMAYLAALNILDADALLSTVKVRSRLDPAIIAKKGIERHHLFPRAHLRDSLGIKEAKRINRIANMVLVEWSDNIDIAAKAPAEYWHAQLVGEEAAPGQALHSDAAPRAARRLGAHALRRVPRRTTQADAAGGQRRLRKAR